MQNFKLIITFPVSDNWLGCITDNHLFIYISCCIFQIDLQGYKVARFKLQGNLALAIKSISVVIVGQ